MRILDGDLGSRLLEETRLWPQTILENYLTVALNLRKCSLTTIPAEYPEADLIAAHIDEACAGQYRVVAGETDPRQKMRLIKQLKIDMRSAFRESVEASSAHKAHVEWSERLGLSEFEMGVRPSIHELFIFKDRAVLKQLEKLAKRRELYRRELAPDMKSIGSRSRLVYPEEFKPDYVRQLGGLLGYPRCCTEAYISGRIAGSILAEERAASQIAELRSKGNEPDPFSFVMKDFMPCNPSCETASTTGRKMQNQLATLDPKLGEFYAECLKRNLGLIESFHDRIEAHRQKIAKRVEELGIPIK